MILKNINLSPEFISKKLKKDDKSFLVEAYLNEIITKDNFEFKNEKNYLDKLVKKVDVFKEVSVRYSKDLQVPLAEETISTEGLLILTKVFVECGKTYKDFKLLNSALKICDGILGQLPKKDTLDIKKEITEFLGNV